MTIFQEGIVYGKVVWFAIPERKNYIDSPGDAPSNANVRKGPKGGLYYDSDGETHGRPEPQDAGRPRRNVDIAKDVRDIPSYAHIFKPDKFLSSLPDTSDNFVPSPYYDMPADYKKIGNRLSFRCKQSPDRKITAVIDGNKLRFEGGFIIDMDDVMDEAASSSSDPVNEIISIKMNMMSEVMKKSMRIRFLLQDFKTVARFRDSMARNIKKHCRDEGFLYSNVGHDMDIISSEKIFFEDIVRTAEGWWRGSSMGAFANRMRRYREGRIDPDSYSGMMFKALQDATRRYTALDETKMIFRGESNPEVAKSIMKELRQSYDDGEDGISVDHNTMSCWTEEEKRTESFMKGFEYEGKYYKMMIRLNLKDNKDNAALHWRIGNGRYEEEKEMSMMMSKPAVMAMDDVYVQALETLEWMPVKELFDRMGKKRERMQKRNIRFIPYLYFSDENGHPRDKKRDES